MKPRIWPYALGFILMALGWTIVVMARHYHYWQATGQEMPGMVSSIRNGVLVAAGVAVAAFVASFVWIKHAPVESSRAAASSTSASPVLPAAATHGNNGAPALLSQTGEKFVLEVRGLGLVTGRNANDEIWNAIEAKADNHSTYMSQSPADYPDSEDSRMTYLGVGTGLSFQLAAHHSVGYWPVPVFIWEPPKASHVSRPANELSGIRQEASLGVTLLLWQEDA
ncbi:type VI lipase adapter Tla3 domain-containing protein, partial [Burkholderia pseudomallei]